VDPRLLKNLCTPALTYIRLYFKKLRGHILCEHPYL